MNIILLYLISALHLFYILFLIGVPILATSNCLLLLHAIIIPFMLAHWYTNQNMCVLTTIEKEMRRRVYGQEDSDILDDCFTCRLIEPVYDFHKDMGRFTEFIYIFVICLWLCTLYKLYLNYHNGKITSFKDLFIC